MRIDLSIDNNGRRRQSFSSSSVQMILRLILLIASCEAFLHKSLTVNQPHLSATPLADAYVEQQNLDLTSKTKIGNIIFLLPSSGSDHIPSRFGKSSPVGNPSLLDAARHIARKAFFFSDGQIDTTTLLVPAEDAHEEKSLTAITELLKVDALIAVGLQNKWDVEFAMKIFEQRRNLDPSSRMRKCQIALDCDGVLPSMVGPYDDVTPSLASFVLPWSVEATARRTKEQMELLLNRWSSDDFTVALMIFFNQFSGSKIDWVKHSIDATWEKGPVQNTKELYSMVSKCGDCISNCLADPTCRECIGKLTEIDTRDQVASYRAIVSFESELLKDFSFCILQKNNIFECDATIPMIPKVEPITTWRGKPLTMDDARSILVGHLDDEAAPEIGRKTTASWRVACGANDAYDKFPSQFQLFYETVNGRDMWYDPVFRVETLDGRNVWCKRHYKVRNGPMPGTFRLSVLDNGVTSNEFWTIAGVADDLSWIVFHYAGAASAVGLRYLGGLVCTCDGSLPQMEARDEIWKVLQSVGIEPWELFIVDNDLESPGALEAGPPPLDYYRTNVLAAKSSKIA